MKILAIGDFQGVFPESLKKKIKKEEFDTVVGVGDYVGVKEWREWVINDLKRAKKGKPRIPPQEYFGKKKFKEILKKDFDAGKKILRTLDSFGKPGVLVFGNGDDDWYTYPFQKEAKASKKKLRIIKKMKNLSAITYNRKKIGGITFVGFGGYMDIDAYFDRKEWGESKNDKSLDRRIKRREKSKKKLEENIKKSSPPRIFVFHYPPKGVFDIIRDKKDNPMNGKSAGIGFFADAIKKHKPLLALCGHMHEYRGMKKLGGIPVINPGDAEKGKAAIISLPENKKDKIKVKFIN